MVLAAVHVATVDEFDAALPDSVVAPQERTAVIADMLADVPLPGGVDATVLADQAIYSDRLSLATSVAQARGLRMARSMVHRRRRRPGPPRTKHSTHSSPRTHWALFTDIDPIQSGYPTAMWETIDTLRAGGTVSSGAGPVPDHPLQRRLLARVHMVTQSPVDDATAPGVTLAGLVDRYRVMDRNDRFRTVYEQTFASLARYARHRSMSATDAEDLLAEVYLVAWRRFDDIPHDAPLPWLFAVAGNVRRNQHRSTRRRRALDARLAPVPATAAPDDGAMSDEIVRCSKSLSDHDRDILLLVAWDGLTPAELAIALGCRAGTARARLHRARRRLAAALVGGAEPDSDTDPSDRTTPIPGEALVFDLKGAHR